MSQSTPHLYITCLAIHPPTSPVSRLWRPRFTKIPSIQVRGSSHRHNLFIRKQTDYGVSSVAFSPDGSRIVAGMYDTTIQIWDARNGEELGLLCGHNGMVTAVAFQPPDGSLVISSSLDTNIRVWDATNGEELKTLVGHKAVVTSIAFLRDGFRIISGSDDGTVRMWDVTSGEELKSLAVGLAVDSNSKFAFSLDGSHIAFGSNDTTVRVLDAKSGEEWKTLRGHESFITSVAFSRHDGSRILSGSYDGEVRDRKSVV